MALACSVLLGTRQSVKALRTYFCIIFQLLERERHSVLYDLMPTRQQLFSVPRTMERFKDHCGMLLNTRGVVMASREMRVRKYRIKVMRKIRIKDGGFRVLQSVSTLLLIDFYLNTVISLLLM